MTVLRCRIESVAFWAPTLPGWDFARAALRGEAALLDPPAKRPAPQILAPAERRRAPDTVALALEVATAAVQAAGRDAAALPCVFTSAHGDLAVNDYMCSTLAKAPGLLSPTRFHNSVHNAAAGYWTIGTGCREASTAVTAYEASFSQGLFEALQQVVADDTPVLLVGYDVDAVGALASVTRSQGQLAVALVLAPLDAADEASPGGWTLEATLVPGAAPPAPLRSEAARSLAGNALADALPLCEALAADALDPADGVPLRLPLTPGLALQLRVQVQPQRPD